MNSGVATLCALWKTEVKHLAKRQERQPLEALTVENLKLSASDRSVRSKDDRT